MDDQNREDGSDEGSDQRDVRGRNFHVLIPGQRDKSNEQPDSNQGNQKRAEETTRGDLVHEFLHDDCRDNRNAQNKQEIDQIVGDRVPGKEWSRFLLKLFAQPRRIRNTMKRGSDADCRSPVQRELIQLVLSQLPGERKKEEPYAYSTHPSG